MFARLTLLVFLLALLAAPASAQEPVSIRAIDPSTFAHVFFGDAANTAIRTTQVPGTQAATSYWTFRITDGFAYVPPNVDYVHDTALTIATSAGPLAMGRASTVAPTPVTADGKAVAPWYTRYGQIVTSPSASADAGVAATECVVLSTASTNATNCKASAGNWYGYDLINTTTTIYYLRLYNLATAPSCSSATGFIRTIPIPPAGSAGQAAGAIRLTDIPVQYSAGLGFCLTAGSTSTDNSNAAAGIFGALLLK